MRILKYCIHLFARLFLSIVISALLSMLLNTLLFPLFGYGKFGEGNDDMIVNMFYLFIVVSLFINSWYGLQPIYFIMTWIKQLSEGHYGKPDIGGLYRKDGMKLKIRHRIFTEVFEHIGMLEKSLQQSELEQKALDELRKDWIASITHDLKTPLTYVKGYSSYLVSTQYMWSDAERNSFSMEIHNKALHMEQLIEDLSLSLRLDQVQIPLKLECCNVVEYLRRILADVLNDPRSTNYELQLHSDESIVELFIDVKLFRRAFLNLLINAVVHNQAGTSIKLSVSRNIEQQTVTVDISDNGVGMDEIMVQHIFDKYYRGTTTDQPLEGTGLGMTIAKRLIEAHGGSISISSQINIGTLVKVKFPYI